MFKLRLKAGQHIMRDLDKPILTPDGKETGRYERKVVNQGGTFEAEENLAAKEPDRYELIEKDKGQEDELKKLRARVRELEAQAAGRQPVNAVDNPSVAPGGQVSTGFQQSAPPGGSAAMTDVEEIADHGGNIPDFQKPKAKATPKKGAAKAADSDEEDDEAEDDLEGKTVPELRELAAEEEVELHGATRKDEIIDAIRKSRK